MMITASYSFAQTHTETIEGLTYSIDEKTNAATLVANPEEKYSGDIVVPEKVTAEDGTASCTIAESSLVIAKVGNKAIKIAVKK